MNPSHAPTATEKVPLMPDQTEPTFEQIMAAIAVFARELNTTFEKAFKEASVVINARMGGCPAGADGQDACGLGERPTVPQKLPCGHDGYEHGAVAGNELWCAECDKRVDEQSSRPERCPRCDSRMPSMHPAVSGGGEVTKLCPDPWHSEADFDVATREQSPRPEWLPEDAHQQIRYQIDGEVTESYDHRSGNILDLITRWYNDSEHGRKLSDVLVDEARMDQVTLGGRINELEADLADRAAERDKAIQRASELEARAEALAQQRDRIIRERDEAKKAGNEIARDLKEVRNIAAQLGAARDGGGLEAAYWLANRLRDRTDELEQMTNHRDQSVIVARGTTVEKDAADAVATEMQSRAEAAEAKVARIERMLEDPHPSLSSEVVGWITMALDGEQ